MGGAWAGFVSRQSRDCLEMGNCSGLEPTPVAQQVSEEDNLSMTNIHQGVLTVVTLKLMFVHNWRVGVNQPSRFINWHDNFWRANLVVQFIRALHIPSCMMTKSKIKGIPASVYYVDAIVTTSCLGIAGYTIEEAIQFFPILYLYV